MSDFGLMIKYVVNVYETHQNQRVQLDLFQLTEAFAHFTLIKEGGNITSLLESYHHFISTYLTRLQK